MGLRVKFGIIGTIFADVAKLVDAQASEACGVKSLVVRIHSSAQYSDQALSHPYGLKQPFKTK